MIPRSPSCAVLRLLLAAAGALAGEEGAAPLIRIRARFDPGERTISGTAEFEFVNPCRKPLDEVLLHVYPNRFLSPNPALNDVNYTWSYPRSFDAGWMEIARISFPSGGSRPADPAFADAPSRPPKTLLRVRAEPPLPPGGRMAVRVEFETRVPLKFGTFGRYDGDYLLNGGWHPYIPPLDPETGWLPDALPPAADFDVAVLRPDGWEAVLNGAHVPAGSPLEFRGRARFLTLALSETFFRYEARESGASVVYYRVGESSGTGRRVCEEAARAIRYFRELYGPVDGRKVVLLDGSFRTLLTDHGDGVGLISDRILRVLSYPVDLRKYHLREVAFEVFYQLGVERARAVESAADWNWVAEGLAWLDLRGYLRWRDTSFDEVTDILGTFSFIPIIDQTLVAPRFPFNDVFFDTFFKSEPHREGILRHNNGTPFGRLAIEKARDAAGSKALAKTLRAHREGRGALPALLEEASGRALGRFVAAWRKGVPRMNYRIGEVREESLGEGRVRITTEILREGGGDFPDVVELGVKCEDGNRYIGKVFVDGERTVDAWVYPDGWSRIAIDPRVRIAETNKTDNHLPRRPKVLVTAFNPRLEMQVKSPFRDSKFNLDLVGGFAGIQEGDYAHQVLLNYFYTKRGWGGSLGYFHAFDAKLDRTEFQQGLGGFLSLERLKRSFALTGDDSTGGDVDLTATSLTIAYQLDTRIDRANPHAGAALYLNFELAEKLFGTDFRFRRFLWDARWLTSPLRENILAFQVRGGLAWGRVPSQRRFSAGGYYGVRGIPENEALGLQGLVLKCEYRHTLLHDLDLNFFWCSLRN